MAEFDTPHYSGISSLSPPTHTSPPTLLYSICYKKSPTAFLFYDSESICAILIKILKNGYLLFGSFPHPLLTELSPSEFYNHTNLHTHMRNVCVGVGESRRSDFSDQHRLHGSIHYAGYLKDVDVLQKNKSTGPAIYFPSILDTISAKWVPSRRSVAHPEPAD